jgi:hypothetical protein
LNLHTYSAEDSLKTASFGLNSGGLGPTMNAPAASSFSLISAGLSSTMKKQKASFELNSAGISPEMNAAATTKPMASDSTYLLTAWRTASKQPLLVSIRVASARR